MKNVVKSFYKPILTRNEIVLVQAAIERNIFWFEKELNICRKSEALTEAVDFYSSEIKALMELKEKLINTKTEYAEDKQ